MDGDTVEGEEDFVVSNSQGVGRKRSDPGDFQAEEVEQSTGGANVEWKRGAGQALMKDLPVRVVAEGDWGSPGTYGDDEVAAVTATVGPDEEVAYVVSRAAALGGVQPR
ncbi:hypothetical protein ACFRIC_41200 [Streptomyces sp. NPDC056738]|uniref:hypothetical protein n=1 Tax=Streptomyces sp. NPDC056738 TaxID=3345933 RepID=UPI0036B2C4FD